MQHMHITCHTLTCNVVLGSIVALQTEERSHDDADQCLPTHVNVGGINVVSHVGIDIVLFFLLSLSSLFTGQSLQGYSVIIICSTHTHAHIQSTGKENLDINSRHFKTAKGLSHVELSIYSGQYLY